MNIILLAITFAFILLLMCDFTKGIILMTSTVFFLNYLGVGLPMVRLYLILSLAIIPLYWYNRIKGRIEHKKIYPRWILFSSIVFAFSMFVSTSIANQAEDAVFLFIDFCTWFVYPYIFWHTINSKEKLSSLFKYITILMVIAIAYTFVEVALNNNPIMIFVKNHNLAASSINDGVSEWLGESSMRFGFRRCTSIFAWGPGFYAIGVFFVFYFLQFRYKFVPLTNKILWYSLLLLPVCLFLSGGRSGMLIFAFSIIPLFLQKRFYTLRTLSILALVFIIGGTAFIGYFQEIINAMINTDTVGGSDGELRSYQLKVSLDYWELAPWWGHGRNYLMDYIYPVISGIGAFEGIWFNMLVDYGVMGCLSFLLLVFGCVLEVGKRNIYFIFLPLTFLLIKTISAQVGIDYSHLIIFSLILIKMHTYYAAQAKLNNF